MGVAKRMKENWMLAVGIALLVIGAFLLAQANSKDSECQSVSGKIIQFLDQGTREDCAGVKTLLFISYTAMGLGVAFTVANFIRRS